MIHVPAVGNRGDQLVVGAHGGRLAAMKRLRDPGPEKQNPGRRDACRGGSAGGPLWPADGCRWADQVAKEARIFFGLRFMMG